MSEMNNPTEGTPVDVVSDFTSVLAGMDGIDLGVSEEPEETLEIDEVDEDEEHEDPEVLEDEEDEESDIDEDEETDAEEDPEEDSEEEQPTPVELTDDLEVTIVVDDEEVEITLGELKNRGMRHADYTNKTKELALERDKVRNENTKVMERSQIVMFQAEKQLADINRIVDTNGGWAQVEAKLQPEQFEQFKGHYENVTKEKAKVEKLLDEYRQEETQRNSVALKDTLNTMHNTHAGFNQETANDLQKYLVEMGINEEEIFNITELPYWELMYKAYKFDKAQSNYTKKKKEAKVNKTKTKRIHKSSSNKAPSKGRNTKMNRALKAQRGSFGQANVAATQQAFAALLQS